MGLKYTNEANENYTINNIQYGLMVGGGVEYAYSEKLSVRLEYYYNDYARMFLSIPNVYEISDPFGKGSFFLSANNIRGSINYWF